MEPLVTIEELYEATVITRKELAEKTNEERIEDWLEWFRKKAPSYIRDAVKKGYYRITMQLPYQPIYKENGDPDPKSYNLGTKPLIQFVKEMLAGVLVDYYLEEYEEGENIYVLEICWRIKKKKKTGFIAPVAVEEESLSTMPSTSSPMMPSSSSITSSDSTAVSTT